jgi:hypothetical protein
MIPALIGILTPILNKVLDKVIPDVAAREQIKLELQVKLAEQESHLIDALIQSDVAQARINEVYAKSKDKFKSYPRQLAMWISVIGLAWTILPVMVGQFFVWFGQPAPIVVQLPEFVVNSLLFGLLGLGAYRTYEKKSGITK